MVLRTFSKAYGMAGLRVGYAIGPKSVIAALDQMQVPWGVNALSLVAAQAALADQGYLHQVVAQIRSDCQALYEGLNERPWLRGLSERGEFLLGALRGDRPGAVAGRFGRAANSRPLAARRARLCAADVAASSRTTSICWQRSMRSGN